MFTGKDNKMTEGLWREVFAEDSDQFTTYYFENKVEDNTVFAARDFMGEIISMIHLTPYETVIGGKHQLLHYVVGVATREDYRHKGYMNRLLIQSLNYLKDQGEPVAFLMPANPAIYEPYEFTYVYDRPEYIRNNAVLKKSMLQSLLRNGEVSHILTKDGIDYEISILKKEEIGKLVEFSGVHLNKNYGWFVQRDYSYYERLCKELKSQNGAVFLIKKGNQIIGWFLYAEEEKEFIQEAIWDKEFMSEPFFILEKTTPIIMVRILDLCKLGDYLVCEEGYTCNIRVNDQHFPNNNGLFHLENGKITQITENDFKAVNDENVVNMSIQELTAELFGYEKNYKLSGIIPWNPVCINEIV